MAAAKPIPDGFTAITPHLVVDGAAKAIDFYKKAFGAEEVCRMDGPGGALMHAEVSIGGNRVMLCDDMGPQWGQPKRSPAALGGCTSTVHMYVKDCDKAMQRAIDAGAEVVFPAMDTFWGDRFGKVKDPFGHEWSIATHIKDMTPEEMAAAGEEWMKNCGKQD